MRKEDVKDRVRTLMENHEDARNSDAWLIAKYWSMYHPDKVERHSEIKDLLLILDKIKIDQQIESMLGIDLTKIVNDIKKKYFNDKGQPIAMIKLIDIANTDHKKNQTTSPETIRRSRQLIQAKGELLPTHEEVRRQRKISEDSYKKWCASNN